MGGGAEVNGRRSSSEWEKKQKWIRANSYYMVPAITFHSRGILSCLHQWTWNAS